MAMDDRAKRNFHKPSMEDSSASDQEELRLLRTQQKFDLRYVLKDGAYKIWVALVLTGAATILSAFLVGVVAVVNNHFHL